MVALLAALGYTNYWRLSPTQYTAQVGLEPKAADISGLREMSVVGLGADRDTGRNVLMLKDKSSDRYLALWIGQTEALAIATQLERVATPRPLAHDLLASAVNVLGGKVVRAMVTDFAGDTFYARVVLALDEYKQVELDARPSDAVALALRAGAPVYVDTALLEKMGIKYAQD